MASTQSPVVWAMFTVNNSRLCIFSHRQFVLSDIIAGNKMRHPTVKFSIPKSPHLKPNIDADIRYDENRQAMEAVQQVAYAQLQQCQGKRVALISHLAHLQSDTAISTRLAECDRIQGGRCAWLQVRREFLVRC